MNANFEARECASDYLATLVPPVLQHFDHVTQAPGGIARLRELVLALAVQGKLVPQDPADEPARALLERIREEKARQVKEGKSRKEKTQTEIPEDEWPFELPPGWAKTSFSELGSFSGGKTPSTHRQEYWGGSIPWVTSKDMKSLRISRTQDYVTHRALYDGLSLIEKNAVLIVVRSGILRRTVPVAVTEVSCTVNQDLKALQLVFNNMANYVQLMVRGFERFILTSLTKVGTTVESIRFEEFERYPFPLPPLAEQSRIVARVEELMALCDALEEKGRLEAAQHERLAAAIFDALANSASADEVAENWQRIAAHFDLLLDRPAAVDRLEQTILHLAVRGRLVPQNPADEPASSLLQKIRAEKDRQIAAGQLRRDKSLPPISDEEKPFELPEGWEWVRTPDVAQSRLGKMLDAAKNTGASYPYLRNTNLQWRRFDLSDLKEIQLEPYELDEYRLLPGDLLICEGGEPGRCAVWQDADTEMYFQKALHRVRPFEGVSSEYLAIALEADVRAGRLDEFFTGATIKHFTGQALERYVIGLPPLAEQSRIVARVAELRALCAQLRDRLTSAAQTQSRLAEALLEQAVA